MRKGLHHRTLDVALAFYSCPVPKSSSGPWDSGKRITSQEMELEVSYTLENEQQFWDGV